jgi:hypothetical protein
LAIDDINATEYGQWKVPRAVVIGLSNYEEGTEFNDNCSYSSRQLILLPPHFFTTGFHVKFAKEKQSNSEDRG